MDRNDTVHPALSRQEKAVNLFKQGFNCSQAVFVAFADLYGLDEELALRMSASFGGGMGRMREVCGCVSAMAMVAGLETGSVKEHDAEGKQRNYEMVQHLAEEFRKVSGGSIICRELLGLSNADAQDQSPTPSARTDAYYKKRPCIELVREACAILENEFGNNKE